MKRNTRKMIRQTASLLAIAAATATAVAAAPADPVAASGYSISLFAGGPVGTSAADLVLVVGNDVYVGYGNGGNPEERRRGQHHRGIQPERPSPRIHNGDRTQ